jgi:hypothetical protein
MWAAMMRSSTLVTPGATTSRVRLPGKGRASSYPMQITGQKLIGHRRGIFRLRSTKTVCLCVKAFSLRLANKSTRLSDRQLAK